MKIAEILSDLTSLRVCGPAEALALVHASRTVSSTSDVKAPSDKDSTTGSADKSDQMNDGDDPEVQKIYELMKLHESLKRRGHDSNTDSGLDKARMEVERVMQSVRQAGGRE